MFRRLVDIEHLAAILSLIDIEHLTRAYSPTTIRVIRIADSLHLKHVLSADALIAALVEENRGIVTVVDNGIAHECLALLPTRSRHILFGITSWHSLNQSDTVTALDILFPRGDVHPAHDVAPRFHHQVIGIVAEPGRHGETHARPLIRSALGIAMHHQATVVEPYLSLAEAGLAETCTNDDLIILSIQAQRFGIGPILCQKGPDGIEIAIAPRPEMQTAQFALDTDGACLARLQGDALAWDNSRQIVVGIHNMGKQSETSGLTVLIAHL